MTQYIRNTALADVTPVTEDAHELRKRAVLEYVRYSPTHRVSVSDIASAVRESISDTIRAIESLRDDGQIEYDAESFRVAFRSQSTLEPIRQQSGALVIAGKLTAVGERFAGIDSAGQQITLSINTEQARWLGKYMGSEVKLTVEVQL